MGDEKEKSQEGGTEEVVKKKRGWPKGKPRKPKDEKKQDLPEKEHKKHRKRRRRRRCRLMEKAGNQPAVKKSASCGVKIIAYAVKTDGDPLIKMTKKDAPELAPCEEIVFKITLEKAGVPANSIVDEVRTFATAFAQCSGLKVVPQ